MRSNVVRLDQQFRTFRKSRCQVSSSPRRLEWLHVKLFSINLILLTWRKWRAPNNASKRQMGFDLAFKGLNTVKIKIVWASLWGLGTTEKFPIGLHDHYILRYHDLFETSRNDAAPRPGKPVSAHGVCCWSGSTSAWLCEFYCVLWCVLCVRTRNFHNSVGIRTPIHWSPKP
jgi:hypothetical protein